jgi:hypothetical protein
MPSRRLRTQTSRYTDVLPILSSPSIIHRIRAHLSVNHYIFMLNAHRCHHDSGVGANNLYDRGGGPRPRGWRWAGESQAYTHV